VFDGTPVISNLPQGSNHALLNDHECAVIKSMLPNNPRGVPQVNDRRVLNDIFWILRSGAPWRDLPDAFGPDTTCYNRFVRWRRAGVWSRIIDALAAAQDAAVQMIDTSIHIAKGANGQALRSVGIADPRNTSLRDFLRCWRSERIRHGGNTAALILC
jgi:transposase